MISTLRDESGMTLVELVITLLIMGIAYLAILGGMTTAITSSTLHRNQANAQTVVRTYAEAVKGLEYISCTSGNPALDPSYIPPGFNLGGPNLRGYQPVYPSSGRPNVQYWHPTRLNSPTGTFDENCATDEGIQKVFLAIRSPDGQVNEKIEVVKRIRALNPDPKPGEALRDEP